MNLVPLASTNPLSKSCYTAGLQCTKRLFLAVRAPEVKPDPADEASQARMDAGTEVGEKARGRYPGGVLIEEGAREHHDAVQATRAAMANPGVPAIFEAAFTHAGVKVRVDLLVRTLDGSGWELHEVKAIKGVKGLHLRDLALQFWVVRGAGVDVARAGILHLDGHYVLGADGLDVQRLFHFADRTAEAEDLLAGMEGEVSAMMQVLHADQAPDVPTGARCGSPYPCPYRSHCGLVAKVLSPTSVENIPKAGALAERARKLGIEDVRDLPGTLVRSARHKIAVEALTTGIPYASAELRAEMSALPQPIGFLDFETFTPFVPRHVGTNPMQVLPTQWSLHVLHPDGQLHHHEFLHDTDTDPRPAFSEALLRATAGCQTLLTYSQYEEAQVKKLMVDLPEHSEALDALLGRVVDLLQLIQKHYYHPAFGNSYSLKRVAPVLADSVRYDTLEIKNGLEAVAAYGRLLRASTEERASLRRALLAYCAVDTRAMVAIWEALGAAARRPGPEPSSTATDRS